MSLCQLLFFYYFKALIWNRFEKWQPDFVKSEAFQHLFEERCRTHEQPGNVFLRHINHLKIEPVLNTPGGKYVQEAQKWFKSHRQKCACKYCQGFYWGVKYN